MLGLISAPCSFSDRLILSTVMTSYHTPYSYFSVVREVIVADSLIGLWRSRFGPRAGYLTTSKNSILDTGRVCGMLLLLLCYSTMVSRPQTFFATTVPIFCASSWQSGMQRARPRPSAGPETGLAATHQDLLLPCKARHGSRMCATGLLKCHAHASTHCVLSSALNFLRLLLSPIYLFVLIF